MNNFWLAVIVSLIIGGIAGWFIGSASQKQNVNPQDFGTVKSQQLRTDMRKLWEDHITFTRLYIVETAGDDDPGINQTAQRLLKNQEDIGNAIKPYYGDDAGNKLTELLKTHITTAVNLIAAAKAGDQTALGSANDKWYANANEIADFLSKANPNLPNDQIRSMMKSHLDLTKQEAVDQIEGRYDAAVSTYDKVHDQILGMSDGLSQAIIKQFPDKF